MPKATELSLHFQLLNKALSRRNYSSPNPYDKKKKKLTLGNKKTYMCVLVWGAEIGMKRNGDSVGARQSYIKKDCSWNMGLKVGHTIHFFHVAVMLQVVFYTLQYY